MKLRYTLDVLFGDAQKDEYPLESHISDEEHDIIRISIKEEKKNNHSRLSLIVVPKYQKISTGKYLSTFKRLTSPLYKGYLINLKTYSYKEDYLKKHFSARTRNRFRARNKKLEQCVQPKSQMYYGAIHKPTYDLLFEHFPNMLEKRFDQKEEINFEIPYIPIYEEVFFSLVQEKRACIYAKFDDGIPICMSISFIYGKTLILYDSGYDVDYEAFNLGHLIMIEHIDWCLKNKFKRIDLCRGDFYHKRKWMNDNYTYHQIDFFKPTYMIATINSLKDWFVNHIRFNTISFLKKMKFHKLFAKLQKLRFKLKYSRNLKSEPKKGFKIDSVAGNHFKLHPISGSLPELQPYKKKIFYHCFSKKLTNPLVYYKDRKNGNAYYFSSGPEYFRITIQNKAMVE